MRLTPDLLLRAYAAGVFPMAESRHDPTLYWLDPERRGIIPIDGFRVPRSLRGKLRRRVFEVRCDTAFPAVIEHCAAASYDRPNTWINDSIIRLYRGLHEMGHAHSVECWLDDRLVGGLYGVALGGAFFGESMFSRVTDASKVALVHLVARLRRGGFLLHDAQFVTDHLRQFGATEISRNEYRRRLAVALSVKATFYPELDGDVLSLLSTQSSTQTS